MNGADWVAAFVNGVLLAAIIATWIWTWWWNRYVVQQQPTPDYEAAEVRLTMELVAWRTRMTDYSPHPGDDWDQEPLTIPLYATRQVIAFNVVNAAFDREGKQ